MEALKGLKVLELGQLIAGPFAGKTLGEFGADVIKVETADGVGDPLRKWRMLRDGTSVWWEVQSRNKRSVCLDLHGADGQDAVRALAAEAARLDLDHVGAEVRERLAGERAGDELAEFEHLQALECLHASLRRGSRRHCTQPVGARSSGAVVEAALDR